MHDQLSVGLHQLTEDECTEVAQKLSAALSYTVVELNRRIASKKAFTAALRDIQRPARDTATPG